jgi:hypothetical protein
MTTISFIYAIVTKLLENIFQQRYAYMLAAIGGNRYLMQL